MELRTPLLSRLSPLLMGTALSLSVLATSCRPTPEASAAAPVVPVDVETLQTGTVKTSTEFVGQLEATQIAEVRTETQGRIERILVTPGQEVAAGQSLLVLRPDQAEPQFQGAIAGVDVAMGQRDNAQKSLDIAKAQRDTVQSTLNFDRANVDRAQKLVAAGGLAQIRLDEAQSKLEASQNQLIAANKQVAAAEVAVQQAEAQIRQAQAQADASQVSVSFRNVVAPVAGVLDNLTVNVGDFVSVGQAITRIAQVESLFLNIEVPPERANQLRTGLTVELLDPNSKQQLATGNLIFVAPTVNASSQSILTRAQFQNVEGRLRDGQFVAARIIWQTQPGILVPTTAISRLGGKDFVFLVAEQPNENGQEFVTLQPVDLGAIQGDRYQVLSGLDQGDRIAVSNILRLNDGVAIAPESSAPQSGL
ncbi:efflux RND transporter periplasmic adaptor subunit [Leptolyngbya sp. KIOST-1]|uniref:efflux RND transporter periplasmic adaptor subunit n=1 Tax=Leptolyngbya sp. KIOST-1 TaxID=1229172 RepID=UPI00056CBEAB|nr:efflux RND transporter periplasmic adaptor subunit [Leptolyngbya sp. KIOST-1]